MTAESGLNIAYFRILQLWFILKIVFIGAQVAIVATAGQARTRSPQDIRVTVTEVKRINPALVEIHVTLMNRTRCDLFLPSDNLGGTVEIHTLELLHWSRDRGWVPLGPFSELPADTAIRLRPGESYTTIHRVPDPAVTPLPGEGIPLRNGEFIPLRGKHMVRVGYLCGAGEWRTYRENVTNSGKRGKVLGPSVQMKFANSDEFNISQAEP